MKRLRPLRASTLNSAVAESRPSYESERRVPQLGIVGRNLGDARDAEERRALANLADRHAAARLAARVDVGAVSVDRGVTARNELEDLACEFRFREACDRTLELRAVVGHQQLAAEAREERVRGVRLDDDGILDVAALGCRR
jgi:hypothetical protein